MTKSYAVEYRGELSGLDARGSTLIFTTRHPEGHPTRYNHYHLDKGGAAGSHMFDKLPCDTAAQLLAGDIFWIAGTDGRLLRGDWDGEPSEIGYTFDAPVVALAATDSGIAAIAGSELVLLSNEGNEEARFDIGEPTRSIASDESGKWIVVGTTRGQICIFQQEDGVFVRGNSGRIHDGEVTALAFAPDELRVYSTGSDCRLLISFVRGSLDTEDRGGKQMHDRVVQDILMRPDFDTDEGTQKRFYTTGLDSSVKSWPRAKTGSQRPATHTDQVVQSRFLTLVELDGEPHLAVGGNDASIRVFSLDSEGRVDQVVFYLWDAYAYCDTLLSSDKPQTRKKALDSLGGYADERALLAIKTHIESVEKDHRLQIHAVALIASSGHPKAPEMLGQFFNHQASDVRLAAFDGLRAIRGEDDLSPLQLAIDSGHQDLGLRGVEGLQKSGTTEAVRLLAATINHAVKTVRIAALLALEHHHKSNPEGTLIGLRSVHADLRQRVIVRLYQRDLLDDLKVCAHLRQSWGDDNPLVRQQAFLVATQRQPNLVRALRFADEQYHRQIVELEEFDLPEDKRSKELPAAKKFSPKKLSPVDLRPLLEAMGSRALDVCMRGARGLAALGDERAMGTLLQLSQEHLTEARVTAAQAFEILGDPRSINRLRLMLHDGEPSVRDAAFSALATLESNSPLALVRATFSAPASDIRARALRLLVATIRGDDDTDTAAISQEARALLLQALNDGAPSIRQEAFKSILNLEVDGGGASTLRFIVQSVHADIRNEVLQEAKSRPDESEYQAVLVETFHDPDPKNHREAFDFAFDRWPNSKRDLIYKAGLSSKQLPLRLHTVRTLSDEKDTALRALLVDALDDVESQVRLQAVQALVRAENKEYLAQALSSPHEDVRVEASAALAELGDERSLDGLLEIIETWQTLTANDAPQAELELRRPRLISALLGLRDLGAPRSITAILNLLDDNNDEVRHAAARALPWVAHPDNLALLDDALRHPDVEVQAQTALAYAFSGEPIGASFIFGKRGVKEALPAAFALRHESRDRFLSFANNTTAGPWPIALILLLELAEFGRVPDRCVALLSSTIPQHRLLAAQAIEHYDDNERFHAWVTRAINDLGHETAEWKLSRDTLKTLSLALAFGTPRLALRAALLFRTLSDTKADRFEREWNIFKDRYRDELAALEESAQSKLPATSTDKPASLWRRLKESATSLITRSDTFEEALTSLAMGAYVGLTREVSAYDSFTIRVNAISGLANLATRHTRFQDDAISVLLMALGDEHASVRQRAFKALETLGAPSDLLSTQALATGYSDMGFQGLRLMASGTSDGTRLLTETMLQNDHLFDEASRLLADRIGVIAVARIGLAAASESSRLRCVRTLSRKYDVEDAAKNALQEALTAQHEDVRFLAATELAKKHAHLAFDTLAEMLQKDDHTLQRQGILGLTRLKDERTSTTLLDRIDHDPTKTADVDALFDAIGNAADLGVADRLLKWIDQGKYPRKSADVALKLTGYPQYQWITDDEVTAEWEESLRPRHPELFQRLLSLAYRLASVEMLSSLVPLAKWPPASEALDAALAPLLTYTDKNIRHRAVEMAGWRLRHREGPAQGLVEILKSGDVLDQFYAAEALALHGRPEGLSILRTAVDVIDDFQLRARAVLAIGTLADPSTVDMLLAIADDDLHILQDAAAEAIGHMSRSDRSDEIFAILKRLASGSTYNKTIAAMKGLRWFDTPGAWDVLRQKALSESWWVVRESVQLLRFNPESRDVVAKILLHTDYYESADYAFESLRYIYGPESLEPDYLLVQAKLSGLSEQESALKRLQKGGESSRILEILPGVAGRNEDEFIPALVNILLSRDPLPVAEAASMLSSDKARTASVAAQIIGRAGVEQAAPYKDDLTGALQTTHTRWTAELQEVLANNADSPARLNELTETYRRLVWAAGQLRVGADEIITAARLDHRRARPIREEALSTLGDAWLGKDAIALLQELATGADAGIRAMAASELHRAQPAASRQLLAHSLRDDVAVTRHTTGASADDLRDTFLDALKDDDVAAVALPKMAALGDINGLSTAMRDANLNQHIRLGAIDALGTIESDDVADLLASFGADEDQEEPLRKAAWRARRRVRRAITQAGGPRG